MDSQKKALRCPFCIENEMVKIVAENEKAYLIRVVTQGVLEPGCYLIIPKEHLESVLALPDDWHLYYKDLLRKVPEEILGHHNGSYNDGQIAGQRVSHVHFWVINRTEESTMPSYGLGLATLRNCLNQKS